MRVLLLNDRIPPENQGGAGKVTWSLGLGLKELGNEVHVISATEKETFEEIRSNIPTYHIHVKYPLQAHLRHYATLFNPQVNAQLSRLYRQIKPDIVNVGNIHSDLTYYSLVIAHRMGIPTVFTAHDVMAFAYSKLTHHIESERCQVEQPSEYRLPMFYNIQQMRFRYNPIRNYIIRQILENYTNTRIVVSDRLRQALEANNLPSFSVVHNGVIAAEFEVDNATVEALRQRLSLQNKKVILFAGRLSTGKGSEQIFAALEQLIQTMPDVVLLVLTRATLAQQGLTQPKWQNLSNHVRIGGWLQGFELAAAYKIADVVVVPSIYLDPFPTINIEAMAAKRPVITTCYGGSSEAIIDGRTGYVINPFDTEHFVEKLTLILSDTDLARKMGEAGYQHFLENFTHIKHSQKMQSVYQDLI